jgi:hypothetical protein
MIRAKSRKSKTSFSYKGGLSIKAPEPTEPTTKDPDPPPPTRPVEADPPPPTRPVEADPPGIPGIPSQPPGDPGAPPPTKDPPPKPSQTWLPPGTGVAPPMTLTSPSQPPATGIPGIPSQPPTKDPGPPPGTGMGPPPTRTATGIPSPPPTRTATGIPSQPPTTSSRIVLPRLSGTLNAQNLGSMLRTKLGPINEAVKNIRPNIKTNLARITRWLFDRFLGSTSQNGGAIASAPRHTPSASAPISFPDLDYRRHTPTSGTSIPHRRHTPTSGTSIPHRRHTPTSGTPSTFAITTEQLDTALNVSLQPIINSLNSMDATIMQAYVDIGESFLNPVEPPGTMRGATRKMSYRSKGKKQKQKRGTKRH